MNDMVNGASGTGWKAPAIKNAIDMFLSRLPEAMLPPVSRVLLYGSYARGDFHTDSDVDLAVVLAGADPGDETHFNLQMRLSVVRTEVIAQTFEDACNRAYYAVFEAARAALAAAGQPFYLSCRCLS